MVVGSNGLVGSSISNVLEDSKNNFNIIKSTRSDADLFSYKETEKLIKNTMPDVLVIAAARVGGIFEVLW